MKLFFLALVAIAVAAAGCGSESAAEKACHDIATAVGKAAARCGGDEQANRVAFEQQVGGCDNVKSVRDEASLRSTCIPSLETINCMDLTAGNLDESCRAQLLR